MYERSKGSSKELSVRVTLSEGAHSAVLDASLVRQSVVSAELDASLIRRDF